MNTGRTHCAIRTRFPATVYLAVTLIIALPQSALPEVLPYRAPRNTEEAVERIEELGGAVRFLKGDDGELEVDFRFATDKLTEPSNQLRCASVRSPPATCKLILP